MKNNNSGQLVCQHLEKISRKALEKYQKIIREYVRKRNGVYALYNKGKLYYVGLASDLKRRIEHHLHDRHANTWDRFSVYLTIGDKHLRELESLILRIASPKGNLQQGKFIKSGNLEKQFLKDMKIVQKAEIDDMFDYTEKESPVIIKSVLKKGRRPVLAKYIKKRIHLRFRYKEKLYIVHVRTNGTITFAAESFRAKELQGKVFTSPSLAACAITKKPMNGWNTWTYERSPGEWVKLDKLRK